MFLMIVLVQGPVIAWSVYLVATKIFFSEDSKILMDTKLEFLRHYDLHWQGQLGITCHFSRDWCATIIGVADRMPHQTITVTSHLMFVGEIIYFHCTITFATAIINAGVK